MRKNAKESQKKKGKKRFPVLSGKHFNFLEIDTREGKSKFSCTFSSFKHQPTCLIFHLNWGEESHFACYYALPFIEENGLSFCLKSAIFVGSSEQ